jgi:hypothetical protein
MATPTFPGAWPRYDEYPRVDRQQSRWTLKNRRYCPWTRNQYLHLGLRRHDPARVRQTA